METPAKINISDLVNRRKLGGFQIGVLTLCGICLMLDGFDVQAMGFIGPALMPQWHISPPVWGRIASAALEGVLVGSLLLSMLADKLGRRPILIFSCLFFAGATLLTARAQSVDEMLILRFIAGIGLGAIMPNAMALVSEYSPMRLRAAMMMVVSNGFTIGAVIVGLAAAWLIPHFGWRSVLYCGGVLPLGIGLLMLFALPESLEFLALKGRSRDKMIRWLKRIDPTAPAGAGVEYVVHEKSNGGFLFFDLFREGRALGTLLIWLIYFLNLLNLYFLASWLPIVIKGSGYSISTSAVVGSMEQVGGMVGAILLGIFVERLGFVSVLTSCFLVAAASIALIGQPGHSLGLLIGIVFVAGFGIVGGQAGVNAFTGIYYPTHLRATGLGAGLGIGRLGSIVGPVLAGILLGRHWSDQQLFIAAAVPALISALVMLAMRGMIRAQGMDAGGKRLAAESAS